MIFNIYSVLFWTHVSIYIFLSFSDNKPGPDIQQLLLKQFTETTNGNGAAESHGKNIYDKKASPPISNGHSKNASNGRADHDMHNGVDQDYSRYY